MNKFKLKLLCLAVLLNFNFIKPDILEKPISKKHTTKHVKKHTLNQELTTSEIVKKMLNDQDCNKNDTSKMLYVFAENYIKNSPNYKKSSACFIKSYDDLTDENKLLYAKKVFNPIFFLESEQYLEDKDTLTVINLAEKNHQHLNLLLKLFNDTQLTKKDLKKIREILTTFWGIISHDSLSGEWLGYFKERIKNNSYITKCNELLSRKIQNQLNIGRSYLPLSFFKTDTVTMLNYATAAYNYISSADMISKKMWVKQTAL